MFFAPSLVLKAVYWDVHMIRQVQTALPSFGGSFQIQACNTVPLGWPEPNYFIMQKPHFPTGQISSCSFGYHYIVQIIAQSTTFSVLFLQNGSQRSDPVSDCWLRSSQPSLVLGNFGQTIRSAQEQDRTHSSVQMGTMPLLTAHTKSVRRFTHV